MGNMGDMIFSASAGADGHWHSATATETGTTNATATATAGAAAKRVRRSSSSGSVPPPLHHSHEDTCPAAAALESAQKYHAAAAAPSPLKSSPQTLRLPAAASAALPLNLQLPLSLQQQLQQQLQLQQKLQLQRQQSNLSGSVSGGGGASGGGASGGAASGGEGRAWGGTNTTTTTVSLGEMTVAVSGSLPLHTQAAPIAPSPLPTSHPPAATPLHLPRSSFPPSAPPDSLLIDEKPIEVAQAPADAGRKRHARGETRKRGRGSERAGRVAAGRQQGASEGAWEEGGTGRRKQQGASEAAWEVRAGDGGVAGGASAAMGGFEEGEDAEGTRVLGRVSGACLAARKRRERIASQMRTLQRLVPGSSRVDTVSVLSDTIRFLCTLIHQIQCLCSLIPSASSAASF
ncbi:unnamed protein product, partial [Closterium sp. NIES-53]